MAIIKVNTYHKIKPKHCRYAANQTALPGNSCDRPHDHNTTYIGGNLKCFDDVEGFSVVGMFPFWQTKNILTNPRGNPNPKTNLTLTRSPNTNIIGSLASL